MQFEHILDPTARYRVVLWNHQQLLGDRLLMTPLVRDLKATYPNWRLVVDVENDIAWHNNPHLEQIITPGKQVQGKVDFQFKVGPLRATQGSRSNGLHITRAFARSFITMTGLPVTDGPFKCDLHLSEAERTWRPVTGDYWVINCDTANMGSKRWVAERWRQLVRSLPELTFVQVGLPGDTRIDLSDEPNVIGLVGQTDPRQLMALVYHSVGCVSLVSSLMHIAAAFDKPAVVLAGGREPRSFAAYPAQHHIDRIGMLQCCRDSACWKNSIEACKDKLRDVPRCMRMIEVDEVADAVLGFYRGGRLTSESKERAVLDAPALAAAPRRRRIRIVSNGKFLGGAERSVCSIARMFHDDDWDVQIATRQPICEPMRKEIPFAAVTSDVSSPCDILLVYASDMVFDFDKGEFGPLGACRAERRVMALTYKLGKVATEQAPWTFGWDKYLFLCSAMESAFLDRLTVPVAPTTVLAPPVDLAPFLKVKPSYDGPVRVVRHSSQGDNKWAMSTESLVNDCPAASFDFMPGPSWLAPRDRLTQRSPGALPVPHFLAGGNLFCYLLPDGYSDQGPRVIVEAMAAGLPVIADKRWGAKDRVTPETGWLIDDHAKAIEIINTVTPEVLTAKGRAARERATTEFDPHRWVAEIKGD